MGKKLIKYTVSVYTEDSVGLLNRISAIFQKRHINIESFNSSMTEIENVQRWTILVITSESLIKKIVGQINKQIEVIQAYYHTDEETIYQESCLFKIKSSLLFDDRKIQNIIKIISAIISVLAAFFLLRIIGTGDDDIKMAATMGEFSAVSTDCIVQPRPREMGD